MGRDTSGGDDVARAGMDAIGCHGGRSRGTTPRRGLLRTATGQRTASYTEPRAGGAWRTGLTTVFLTLAVLASAHPAFAQGEIELLSATLTPMRLPDVHRRGCTGRLDVYCNQRLTDDRFTEDGVTYSILWIIVDHSGPSAGKVEIAFNRPLPARLRTLTLHVDSSSFVWPDGRVDFIGSHQSRYWPNSGLTWTVGTLAPLSRCSGG